MKVQISPTRIIKDAVTIWNEAGPEVDVVMDIKNLTFRPGSIDELYSFSVLNRLFISDAITAAKNWHDLLSPGGNLHVVVDDFEYVARAFTGGDISIDIFNEVHNCVNQCTRDSVSKILSLGGFDINKVNIWLTGAPEGITKKHYELIITATKHGNS